VGVNLLGPLGSICFSVGDGGGGAGEAEVAVVVVVVVVVVDVSGAFWPPPQAEANAPIATMAATPANICRRSATGRDFIDNVLSTLCEQRLFISCPMLCSDNGAWR
jgi:hypothetical protein